MSGRITALKVQKRNPRRVNVYIDGQFAFGLAAIEAMRLHVGQQLSADDIARLRADDQRQVAYDRALHFLSFRPRSQAEVERHLRDKFAPEVVEQVIARLERAGLVDDRAFVRFWIENRDTFRPRGKRALRYELRQKGVPAALIDAALQDYDEEAAARRAAQDRVRKLRHLDEAAARAKLLAFLNRRGFSYATARQTVDELVAHWSAASEETE